jgi:hypothetical protein
MKNYHFALFIVLCACLSAKAQGGISDNQDVVTALSTEAALLERVPLAPNGYLSTGDTTRNLAEPVSVVPRLLTLKYDAPSIRPIALRKSPPKSDYKFWSKLGYGLPNQAFAELSYQTKTMPRGYVGAYAKYHSADNNAAMTYQRFQDIFVQLNGTYFIDTVAAISAKIGYKRNDRNFYGYDHTALSFAPEQITQRFNKVFGGLSLYNTKRPDNDFHYQADLDIYSLTDHYNAAETGVVASIDLKKYFEEQNPVAIKITNSYIAYNQADTAKNTNRNLLSLDPSFTFHAASFRARVGANVQLPNSERVTVTPDVELSYTLGAAATIFGGWQGGLRQNTLATLSDYNPYVLSRPTLRNSKAEDRFVGIKGKYDAFTYEVRAYNQPVENMPIFINDAGDTRRFAVVYDTINSFGGHLGIGFRPIKALEIGATGDYRVLTPKTLKAAYHIPNLEANFSTKYNVTPELETHLIGFVTSGITYLDTNIKTQTLPTIFDLNLGASYRLNDNIALFLDANNLLNQKYQRWNGYATYGLNVLGGVILKFK